MIHHLGLIAKSEPTRRNGRRFRTVLLALVGLALGLVAAPVAGARTTTLGSTADSPTAGGCTACTVFQAQTAQGPGYVVPPGHWTLTSWSGQGGKTGGTARLKVFRPGAAPGQLQLLAQSGMETFAAATVSSYPAAIEVDGGDVLGLRTGSGYPAGFVVPDLGDVSASVEGSPEPGEAVGPGTAHSTNTFGGHRVNLAATLEQADPPPAPAASTTNVLSLYVEGRGSLTVPGTALDCPRVCGVSFPTGTGETVYATPGPRSEFGGWSGACAGLQLTCPVALSGELQVNGRFLPSHDFTLGKVKRKRGHGHPRAVQRITVENPGAAAVAGKGVVAARVVASKPGAVTLPLVAKGKALRTTVRISFIPKGGTRKTTSEKVVFAAGSGR